MDEDFSRPELFINRELSWLEFNARVLEEAQDKTQPLLERVKFLCIFSSNLDEFFEIRVSGIKQQIQNNSSDIGPDGMSASQIFSAIQKRTRELVAEQSRLWNEELMNALAKEGIQFPEVTSLKGADKIWARKYFVEQVFPVLTPLAIDPSHPFPQVLNKAHYIIVKLRKSARTGGGEFHAVVQLPRILPRLIPLPSKDKKTARMEFIALSKLIKLYAGELFPGIKVEGAYSFRVTRNSDLYIDEEEEENLLRTIESNLRKRNKGNAVRLEVQTDCPEEIEEFLLENLHLEEMDLYKIDGPINIQHLMQLCTSDQFPLLKDRPFYPSYDLDLPPGAEAFGVLKKEDVLLHHPYENFDTVIDFISQAAEDPAVLAIKMTLYRTSGDSQIVKALIAAANNGKQVTALVELKARFDEANNIQWARLLEEAGVHVVYGVVGLKVHCKCLLIVRRDGDIIRRYAHLGTGNYHPRTARLYTDLSLLTSNETICSEVAQLFNSLTGLSDYPEFSKLLVAPFDMASRLSALIQQESANAAKGLPAKITIKVNSLVDESLIRALFEASCAGVKVDLIVRGICCLRPGIKGVSENIRVISIVGRFLEHSRIYYFENAGQPLVYLGSADLMPRNLYRRVEVLFPIEADNLLAQIRNDIIPAYLTDNVKARELRPDGTYVRLRPGSNEKPMQAQLHFREWAREQSSKMNQNHAAAPKKTKRFVPIKTHR